MPMDQRTHIRALLRLLYDRPRGECGNGGMIQDNCHVCPLSRSNGGMCGIGQGMSNYRQRKLEALLAYMRSHNMQDIIDENKWMVAIVQDDDALYASMPI